MYTFFEIGGCGEIKSYRTKQGKEKIDMEINKAIRRDMERLGEAERDKERQAETDRERYK